MTPTQMRKELDELLNEGMYNTQKKPRPAAQPSTPASNDIFIDRSMESPDKIAITLKGRTALIKVERVRAMITKLERLLGEIEDGNTDNDAPQ